MKNKTEWKDATSYSRDDKERKPSCWSIEEGPLEVTVVWNHRARPGMWCFHSRALGCDTETLPGVKTEQEAKDAALRVIEYRLNRLQTSLNAMRSVTPAPDGAFTCATCGKQDCKPQVEHMGDNSQQANECYTCWTKRVAI